MNTQPTRSLIEGRPARALGNHLAAQNDEAEVHALRQSNQDHADFKTRAARAEIAKLAQYMSGQDAIAILASLVTAFGTSLELRTSVSAQNALEHVLDAVGYLEDAEAIDG